MTVVAKYSIVTVIDETFDIEFVQLRGLQCPVKYKINSVMTNLCYVK